MKYDVENSLKKYMPSLIELLGNQKIKWSSINSSLQNFVEKGKTEYELTGQTVARDATFYSIIIRKLCGEGVTDGMFDFYNKTCKSLIRNLTEGERKPLHRMISKVLLSLDYRYLNFIGELATLNKLMETGEYELINIEELISPDKGKRADLFVRRKKDNLEILIEVLNLHIEMQEFIDFQSLEYYLKSKLSKKVKEKLVNPNRIIFIQPVLWIKDLEQLQFVCDFYAKTSFTIENVKIPMSYVSYMHSNGSYEHRFESIKTILKN